jgi:hypothetical protein
MDPESLRELVALESAQWDASFEYWLGASFAVVVAAHAARDSLLTKHRQMLCGVYVLFCLATLAKSWADVDEIARINNLIIDTDLSVVTVPNIVATIGRYFIYLVFSVVVTVFIFRSGSWYKPTPPDDA